MNYLFYRCVEFMHDLASFTGLTYEEVNIWLFVIIHPIITLLLIIYIIKLKLTIKNQKSYDKNTITN